MPSTTVTRDEAPLHSSIQLEGQQVTFTYKGQKIVAPVKHLTITSIYAETNPMVMGKKYWKIRKLDGCACGS